jgi:hypothetical protein
LTFQVAMRRRSSAGPDGDIAGRAASAASRRASRAARISADGEPLGGVTAELFPRRTRANRPGTRPSMRRQRWKSGVPGRADTLRPFGSSHSSWRPSAVRSKK